ncbi:alpha/beta fold hydrolase [Roseomonas eburnea]|uniref:Alpha/beta fold hydrolase n=1 Tax=Neoroseomonas eburnea TaxID=1346889 RepID=A0A9X9X5K0_9PROT|nr:alpha/beta fold hydrolase [Neoroseomonas eburnea]MBR0678986.1 alpha/beta fold hydrolase [Neoroseomonas eburnea]
MLTTIAVLAAIPLLLVGALWAGQERMIFLPDTRAIAAPPGWTRETLRTEDGLNLAFLVAEAPPGAPVLLHFHGNGGNAEDRTGLGSLLRRAGYGVVLAEYRGYGGNPGRPGEEAIARDARSYLAWTRARFAGSPVALWGESLGSAVATRLAENQAGIAALVLESPFTSVADMARGIYPVLPTDWLLRHRFESLSRLHGIAAPVLVVASEQDRITPAEHARRMAEGARNGALVMLPGEAHPTVLNDASGEGMRAALDFLRR